MEQEHIYQLIGERATCSSYRPDSNFEPCAGGGREMARVLHGEGYFLKQGFHWLEEKETTT